MQTKVCVENLESTDLDIHQKIIIKMGLKEIVCGLNSTGSTKDLVASSSEHSNKPIGSRNDKYS